MAQWVADAQIQGVNVSYTASNSPDGLNKFKGSTVDFAGTEAEFSSLLPGQTENAVPRGFQYVPDVAGAVAIMYNVDDRAGNEVKSLRLSRRTIAKIFIGEISNWSDRAITADNGGIQLPNKDITVVFRTGQSGTTALFYDFVQHMEPTVYRRWLDRNRYRSDVRLVQLDSSGSFVPHPQGATTSEVMARTVANQKWTISYDEFSYALVEDANVAFVQNQAGNWVKPFAANISGALEAARLRPDLSQDLSRVYTTGNPIAYPISAYSYIVTQCARAGDRPTCKGNYRNAGVAKTLTEWLRYIACAGQVEMATIGYSPLPPNLSQEIANSIGRMNGKAPERLTARNCANPRFQSGFVLPGSPAPPPLPNNAGSTTGPAEAEGAGTTEGTGSNAGATTTTTVAASDEVAAAGREGATESAGGGSGDWRDPDPVAFDRPGMKPLGLPPLVVLLAVLAIPPLVIGAVRWLRRPRL